MSVVEREVLDAAFSLTFLSMCLFSIPKLSTVPAISPEWDTQLSATSSTTTQGLQAMQCHLLPWLSPRLLALHFIMHTSFCLYAVHFKRDCLLKGCKVIHASKVHNQFTVCRDERNHSIVKRSYRVVMSLKTYVNHEDCFPSIPSLHTPPQCCLHILEPTSAW